ncbi:MAG TPA: hypothetical protein PLK42_03510, partial [Casimicrobium sp.]|nr:hypothetical protein [Casimicrobium sp.]
VVRSVVPATKEGAKFTTTLLSEPQAESVNAVLTSVSAKAGCRVLFKLGLQRQVEIRSQPP